MELTLLTWNLFHGRDAPPDPALFTRRSRFLRISESSATHVQVNRDLRDEFTGVIAGAAWDVALLQECPPRWTGHLARACAAEPHRSLTSRNRLRPLRALAARINPDLIGSNEGGSNLILSRSRRRPELEVVERRELVLRERPPERRTMAFARLACGLGVANLHATNDRPELAAPEVLAAAEAAAAWTGDGPLVLGGDFNLRPGSSEVYRELEARHGLEGATGPDRIDHLLVSGAAAVAPPRAWPAAERELDGGGGLALRLSDHAPVELTIRL